MPARIGYLLPTREQIMAGRPRDGAAAGAGRARRAAGLRLGLGRRFAAGPAAARAADAARRPSPAATSRVELGTAVLLPALRNPVVLAHQVATLDQISEGRLILGVGIARDVPDIRAEFVAAGVPFEKRVGRMLEGLRLCRELWTRQAGRLGRPLEGRRRRAGADAAPPGRPADLGRRLAAGQPRAGGAHLRRLDAERRRRRAVGAAVGADAGHRARGRPRSGRARPAPCT